MHRVFDLGFHYIPPKTKPSRLKSNLLQPQNAAQKACFLAARSIQANGADPGHSQSDCY